MPTLRERLANIFIGDQVKQLKIATSMYLDLYERELTPISPEKFMEQFGEMDPRYMDFLVRQFEQRSTSMNTVNEQMRLKTVEECRSLYVWDVITGNIVDLWTDYGYGMSIEIVCEDDKAQEVFQEFWTARRNSPVIGDRVQKDLSKDQCNDGELFFACFGSRVDGDTTVRLIPTEEITKLITDPDDNHKVLYYERKTSDENGVIATVFYRDWQASAEDLKRAELPDGAVIAEKPDLIETATGEAIRNTGTDVVILHAAYKIINGRGWPLMTAGAPWSRAYRNFLQDRAAVARQAAMYNEKIKVKGNQRVIDDIRTRLESSLVNTTNSGYDTNPPAVAGSTWLENEGMDRTRQPMGTGASDAEKDGSPLLAQAGLAGRIFPHYLGRGEAFRLATASAMETPVMRAFNRYQQFWSSVFRDMVEIVLRFKEQYGGEKFSSYAASVSTDKVITVDIGALSQISNSLVAMSGAMILSPEVSTSISTEIMRVALQTVGVSDVDKIMNPKENPVETEEMAESAEQYQSSMRQAVYGLWSSKITMQDFASSMQASIDRYLTQAWKDGMKEAGVDWEDRTQEEMSALDEAILSEYQYLYDFGAYIMENNKEAGGLFRDLANRMSMWANRWRDVKGRALMMAGADLPLTWHFGGTEEHCGSCGWANGRTYRASVWEKYGWRTQSQDLECKGFNCLCELTADGNKPTRGHPKRLA